MNYEWFDNYQPPKATLYGVALVLFLILTGVPIMISLVILSQYPADSTATACWVIIFLFIFVAGMIILSAVNKLYRAVNRVGVGESDLVLRHRNGSQVKVSYAKILSLKPPPNKTRDEFVLKYKKRSGTLAYEYVDAPIARAIKKQKAILKASETEVPEERRFCPGCGCVNDGWQYCPKCGRGW